jgi:hypothetical protein
MDLTNLFDKLLGPCLVALPWNELFLAQLFGYKAPPGPSNLNEKSFQVLSGGIDDNSNKLSKSRDSVHTTKELDI